MRIDNTNLCVFHGDLMIENCDAIERARGLIITAINELINEGYDPNIIKSLYKSAKAQVKNEKQNGFDCDNAEDVADLYEFIMDILSVVSMYMDEGIKGHSDQDREIAHKIGDMLDILDRRSRQLRDYAWEEMGDA